MKKQKIIFKKIAEIWGWRDAKEDTRYQSLISAMYLNNIATGV